MKKLVFNDGTKAYFTDDSTILDCKVVLNKFGEIDELAEEFTLENLNGGTFDEATIENVVPVSVSATKDGDKIIAHFINRTKTESELLKEKMDELDELIAKLKGKA